MNKILDPHLFCTSNHEAITESSMILLALFDLASYANLFQKGGSEVRGSLPSSTEF